MSNFPFLNQCRIRQGFYGSDDSYGFNGMFSLAMEGEARRICVVASDQEGWQHVSVSFGPGSTKTPSWEVMNWVKDLFWNDEDWVVQYHPAKSENISFHPGCLHLWRPLNETFPKPPPIMIGPKI